MCKYVCCLKDKVILVWVVVLFVKFLIGDYVMWIGLIRFLFIRDLVMGFDKIKVIF